MTDKEKQFREFITQLSNEKLLSFKETLQTQLEWIEDEEQSRG